MVGGMVPLPDANLIVAIVSAAFEGIQTWLAFRDRRRAAEAMESSLAAAQRRPSTFEQGAILADIVPHDVLDLMIQRVRKCWDYYKEVLEAEEDFLPAQVDNATRAFERCICRELKRIMRLNKSLPPGDLERWWKAYCAA